MSRIEIGSIVLAKAGKDKEGIFVVVGLNENQALIVNGKSRKLSKPKPKNLRHLSATKTKASQEDIQTDSRLRKFLRKYKDSNAKV